MGSELLDLQTETRESASATINVPAPTAWPIVLAFGVALLFAGLVTSASLSILGAILAVSGCVGWFRDVLPQEKHESLQIAEKPIPVVTSRPEVAQVSWIPPELHRPRLPLEIYPISAGVKGGLAGSVVMAVLAMIYGIASKHGIWYPINLLAAGFFPARNTTAQISAFHWDSFVIAVAVHLVTSLIVGLLYGAMLPMFPRRPILLGGFAAPLLWSGLLHSILGMVDPVLNQRIDWFWFVLSQFGFGIVAGFVVSRQVRVRTWQHLPFPIRAGVEATGAMDDKSKEDQRQ
jgi:hypothetical protein